MAKRNILLRVTISLNEDDSVGKAFMRAVLRRLNVLHVSTKPKSALRGILGDEKVRDLYEKALGAVKPNHLKVCPTCKFVTCQCNTKVQCPVCMFYPCNCEKKTKGIVRYIGRNGMSNNQITWEVKRISEVVMPSPGGFIDAEIIENATENSA